MIGKGLRHKKGIIIAAVAFVLVLIADTISTLRLGELTKYLEASPLYETVGITGIVILNLVLLGLVIYLYHISSMPSTRFIWTNALVTVVIIRILVVLNNIRVGLNPPTIQQAMQVTQAMKTATITHFAFEAFFPYLIAIVTYWLFTLDHKIEVKNV